MPSVSTLPKSGSTLQALLAAPEHRHEGGLPVDRQRRIGPPDKHRPPTAGTTARGRTHRAGARCATGNRVARNRSSTVPATGRATVAGRRAADAGPEPAGNAPTHNNVASWLLSRRSSIAPITVIASMRLFTPCRPSMSPSMDPLRAAATEGFPRFSAWRCRLAVSLGSCLERQRRRAFPCFSALRCRLADRARLSLERQRRRKLARFSASRCRLAVARESPYEIRVDSIPAH
jgi:hypothetical protein